jgi:hypothetical protein
MSASNAAARKRRAPQSEAPAQQQNNIRPQVNAPNVNQTGLTLPQVINIIDNRLIKLETFMKESSTTINDTVDPSTSAPSEWIGEFNNRFEILAEEIGNLKDIVLKLQSYTMDVNKTLLEERIHVFSDLNTKESLGENIVLETIEPTGVHSLNLQSLVSQELNN